MKIFVFKIISFRIELFAKTKEKKSNFGVFSKGYHFYNTKITFLYTISKMRIDR